MSRWISKSSIDSTLSKLLSPTLIGLAALLLGSVWYGSACLGHLYTNVALSDWNRQVLPECSCVTPLDWPVDKWTFVLPHLETAVRLDGVSSANRMIGYYEASQGRVKQAVKAWQNDGLTINELVAWGQLAEEHGQIDSALHWYHYAAHLEPSSGAPDYYIGQLYGATGKWEQTLGAFYDAVEHETLVGAEVRRGDIYRLIGDIYRRQFDPPDLDRALTAYAMAVQTDAFATNWSKSEAYYLQGFVLWNQDRQWEAFDFFKAATEIRPSHYASRYWLGVAYFEVKGDVEKAEDELLLASELRPDSKWPFLQLGNLYFSLKRYQDARSMYLKVLEIDPSYQPAQNRLDSLQSINE